MSVSLNVAFIGTINLSSVVWISSPEWSYVVSTMEEPLGKSKSQHSSPVSRYEKYAPKSFYSQIISRARIRESSIMNRPTKKAPSDNTGAFGENYQVRVALLRIIPHSQFAVHVRGSSQEFISVMPGTAFVSKASSYISSLS